MRKLRSWSYYFASRYNRHPELRRYRAALLAAVPQAVVTSRWIDCHDGALEQSLTPEALTSDPATGWKYAAHDIEDLAAADTLVSFTGPGGKGGRHVEHGYAMAADKRIVIIGPRENVFHCDPAAEVYASWQDFLVAERARQSGAEMTNDANPAQRAVDRYAREMADGDEWVPAEGETMEGAVEAPLDDSGQRRLSEWVAELPPVIEIPTFEPLPPPEPPADRDSDA